jgi:proteasome assembly chaperone (PAC2) family protein
VNDDSLIKDLEKIGVILERSGVGHIIGASGLLLGLSKLRNIGSICLMGETSGFYVDPKSAKAF